MIVVSGADGFVLVFRNKNDIETHVNNLKGFLEYVARNKNTAPHLYSVSASKPLSEEELRRFLRKLKVSLKEMED